MPPVIESYRQQINEKLQQRKLLESSLQREQQALSEADLGVQAVVEAQEIVQRLAQTIQQRIHRQIASIVSRCLTAVFDDPYTFSIRFDRKRSKTEATMVFSRDGKELESPLEEVGGGVVELAAFGLRLACLLISQPPGRRMLILDEPFKSVRGTEYRSRVRQLLIGLSEELGIQILLNTDLESFQLGTIIELT
jgi:hypothetical protein